MEFWRKTVPCSRTGDRKCLRANGYSVRRWNEQISRCGRTEVWSAGNRADRNTILRQVLWRSRPVDAPTRENAPDTQSLANSFLQFFSDKIERIRSKFSPSDSLILFFFQSSLLQIYPISIQPLFRKFVISFSLLKTNNVNLTQFLLSFWNTVLTNLDLLSLI